jgi:hypothetical protein
LFYITFHIISNNQVDFIFKILQQPPIVVVIIYISKSYLKSKKISNVYSYTLSYRFHLELQYLCRQYRKVKCQHPGLWCYTFTDLDFKNKVYISNFVCRSPKFVHIELEPRRSWIFQTNTLSWIIIELAHSNNRSRDCGHIKLIPSTPVFALTP